VEEHEKEEKLRKLEINKTSRKTEIQETEKNFTI
jgi:hypothetical protein